MFVCSCQHSVLYGHYDVHLKEAMQKKSHPNMHLVRYEDMKADPLKEYKRLDVFLGTKCTQEQLEKVCIVFLKKIEPTSLVHISFWIIKSKVFYAFAPVIKIYVNVLIGTFPLP